MGKTLYIMQGIPGSGKSTIAKIIADRNDAIIFSTDDYWYARDEHVVHYNFDVKLLGEAHRWNQRRCIDEMASKDGGNIVIDNTNIKKKDAQIYFDLAAIYGYEVQVISVQVPTAVAIERQKTRPADRQIPSLVIDRMAKNMEALT